MNHRSPEVAASRKALEESGESVKAEKLTEEQRSFLYHQRFKGVHHRVIAENFNAEFRHERTLIWDEYNVRRFYAGKNAKKEYQLYVTERSSDTDTLDLGSVAAQIEFLADIARGQTTNNADKLKAIGLIASISEKARQSRAPLVDEKPIELTEVLQLEGFGDDDPLMGDKHFTTMQQVLIKMIDESSESTLRSLKNLSKEEIERAIEMKTEIELLRERGIKFAHEKDDESIEAA